MDRVKEEVIEGDCTPWMDSAVSGTMDGVKEEVTEGDFTPWMDTGVSDTMDGVKEEVIERGFTPWMDTGVSDTMDRVKEEVIERDFTPWMNFGVVVKQEPAWSMEEDSPDHPSAVYRTAQPMSDNTSGSLLSLKRGRVCQRCSAAFVLVSSLELHLASVHGEPLPFHEWTESIDRLMSLPHGRPSTEETDHVRKYSADSAVDFSVKQEPAWSMEEDSPDQPSAVYSTAQPMSDNTSGSLLSLKRGRVCQRCSAAFVLVSSLELHLVSVHGELLPFHEWTESSDRLMTLPHGRLSTEETDHVRKCSADSAVDFAVKLEPAWSMEEDSPDQSSAVYSTVQPMSDNTSESLLSLKRGRVCQHCSAAFVLVSSLELHLASVHGDKLHMVLPGSSTPDRCDAGNCSNTDRNKEVVSHGNRKITKKTLDDSDTSDTDGKKSRRQHVCDVCRKSFLAPSALRRHRLIHSGVKPFACDMCSKSFNQAGHLKAHKLSHGSYKPFVCDVCSKSFTLPSNLTQHKKVHTGERPYKCPYCNSVFAQSGSLQIHIKSVHEGARPHRCDVCGAAFSGKGGLTVHKRIHTGEKPHVCSDCGKEFAHSSSFRKHCLTHTGEKPHVCSDCGKGFARSSNLARHCLAHTGQKPHSCSYCPYASTSLQNVKRHMLSKHQ